MADITASPLVSCLQQLEDPRIERAKRHELLDLLVLCVLATICGADSMVAIEEFGKAQQKWLRTFLALPHGIPSHDTVGRVLARLDAAQFEACFLGWVQAAFTLTQGQVVAIDGKSVRPLPRSAAGPVCAASGERLGATEPPGAGPAGRGQPVQRDHRHPAAVAPAGPGRLHRDH